MSNWDFITTPAPFFDSTLELNRCCTTERLNGYPNWTVTILYSSLSKTPIWFRVSLPDISNGELDFWMLNYRTFKHQICEEKKTKRRQTKTKKQTSSLRFKTTSHLRQKLLEPKGGCKWQVSLYIVLWTRKTISTLPGFTSTAHSLIICFFIINDAISLDKSNV